MILIRQQTYAWTRILTLLLCLPRIQCQGDPNNPAFVASEECPCINPWEFYNITLQQGNCPEGQYEVFKLNEHKIECASKFHGSNYCNEWDLANTSYEDACFADNIPNWCRGKWCYVETDNCNRPNALTSLSASSNDEDRYPFSYSYQTCGYPDRYEYSFLYKAIEGKRLRVTYPEDSADGYTLRTEEDGSKSGAYIELQENIFRKYNVTVEVMQISDKSKAMIPTYDSIAQCVYDVMLGETDICVGPVIETKRRLEYASLPSTIAEDTQKNLRDYLTTPLKPFTFTAWALLWFGVIYMTIGLFIVQDKYSISSSKLDKKMRLKKIPRKAGGYMLNNIYYGSRAFAEGGVVHESDHPETEEKVIIFGFTIFALIILTAYTATSAAALVVNDNKAKYHSITEVVNANVKICVPEVFVQTVSGLYPDLKANIEITRDLSDVYELMDNKKCTVGISSQDILEKQNSIYGESCNKVLTERLFASGTTFAVRDEFLKVFSYIFSEYNENGIMDDILKRNKEKFVGNSICRLFLESDQFDRHLDDYLQLGVKELLAPIVITLCCTTFGLMVFFGKKVKTRYYPKSSEKEVDGEEAVDENNVTSTELKLSKDQAMVVMKIVENAILNSVEIEASKPVKTTSFYEDDDV